MLSLSRKENESIICILEDGREIEIFVSQIKNDQVRLSIGADKTINVVRDELLFDKSRNGQGFIYYE